MIRIGLIGSDNSHAKVFSLLANGGDESLGEPVEGARITHLYGDEGQKTHDLVRQCGIDTLVDEPSAMIGHVDAIICVWRHARRHLDVLPFLSAGIPVFVDKPLAMNTEDALRLLDAAHHGGAVMTSFSSLRYEAAFQQFCKNTEASFGTLASGMCSGPADVTSEYGGIFFYGIHTVEIMHAVWGYGCRSVYAVLNDGNLQVMCRYSNGSIVTLNFLKPGKAPYVFHVMAFGDKGWGQFTFPEETTYYRNAFQVILDMFNTRQSPYSSEQLLEPVRILEAIALSIQAKKEVILGLA